MDADGVKRGLVCGCGDVARDTDKKTEGRMMVNTAADRAYGFVGAEDSKTDSLRLPRT